MVIALPQCCFPLKHDSDFLCYLRENMVLSVLTGSECILDLEANKGSPEERESSDGIYIGSTNKPLTATGKGTCSKSYLLGLSILYSLNFHCGTKILLPLHCRNTFSKVHFLPHVNSM